MLAAQWARMREAASRSRSRTRSRARGGRGRTPSTSPARQLEAAGLRATAGAVRRATAAVGATQDSACRAVPVSYTHLRAHETSAHL
eukprot:4050847-Alexandrium_andersonii.AAC.1